MIELTIMGAWSRPIPMAMPVGSMRERPKKMRMMDFLDLV
jgi:hypothetical protein